MREQRVADTRRVCRAERSGAERSGFGRGERVCRAERSGFGGAIGSGADGPDGLHGAG
jgi:hypothetical protein